MLVGFTYLFTMLTPFHITDGMVIINAKNKIKVWINQNFASCQPNKSEKIPQNETLRQIISLCNSKCIQSNLSKEFFSQLYQNYLQSEECFNFVNVIETLTQFISSKKIMVPQKISLWNKNSNYKDTNNSNRLYFKRELKYIENNKHSEIQWRKKTDLKRNRRISNNTDINLNSLEVVTTTMNFCKSDKNMPNFIKKRAKSSTLLPRQCLKENRQTEIIQNEYTNQYAPYKQQHIREDRHKSQINTFGALQKSDKYIKCISSHHISRQQTEQSNSTQIMSFKQPLAFFKYNPNNQTNTMYRSYHVQVKYPLQTQVDKKKQSKHQCKVSGNSHFSAEILKENGWNKKISDLFSDTSTKQLKGSVTIGKGDEPFTKPYLQQIRLQKLDLFGRYVHCSSMIEDDNELIDRTLHEVKQQQMHEDSINSETDDNHQNQQKIQYVTCKKLSSPYQSYTQNIPLKFKNRHK